jgi:hypothetical protein
METSVGAAIRTDRHGMTTGCNVPCEGNTETNCGGSDKNEIYSVNPATKSKFLTVFSHFRKKKLIWC